MAMLRVRFDGAEYVLTGESLEDGGAIATAEEYVKGLPSFAHLFPDGLVMRYGVQIGTRADVEVLETIPDLKPDDFLEAFSNMATHPGWL